MPSSVSPDPRTYTHPADQTVHNVFYHDQHVDRRLNIYYNSTRVTGGNPVLVIVHGGSWAANEKTGFVEFSSSASLGGFWFAYFLDSVSYGTTAYFDVVSIEYSAHSHDGSTTVYEPFIATGSGFNSLKISYPTYGKAVDDVQRALQYLDDIADRAPECPAAVANGWTGPRWNRNKKVLAAHSVGACTSLVAAFKPSRPWNPHATGEYQARYESKVCGVINWAGEVDLDPWVLYFRHAKFLLGKVQATAALIRADVDRELLKPNASGAFPQGSDVTQKCREFSPLDAVEQYASYKPTLKIRSHYLKNFGITFVPQPPWGPSEETQPPSAGAEYATIPPDDASGHFWQQWQRLATKCATHGITHSGYVIDGSLFTVYGPIVDVSSPTGVIYYTDIAEGWMSTLAETYADVVTWIADD